MKLFITVVLVHLSVFSFGQTGNFWTRVSDFAGLKRERAVAFTINDKAYVGTGVDTAEVVHKDFWVFDPILNTWGQVADLPGSVRRNAVAFAINDIGYVTTGIDSAAASAFGAEKLDDLWAYDPVANSWTQKADFIGGSGNGIYFATAFALGDYGFVCCGKMGPNQYSSQLWQYDPLTDQWSQSSPFPGGVRYQLCSFVIDNTAYVGLGTDQNLYKKDLWAFDGLTQQWTAKNDVPASERASTMTFTIGQRGYLCMGANGGYLDDLWEYNPFADQWTSRANFGGSERKNAVAFTLLGKGYLGTGKGYSGKKLSVYSYTPEGFVGLDEQTISMNVYPNPSTDIVHLSYTDTRIENIELYSLGGKKVLSEQHAKKLSVSHLVHGTYLLIARGEDQKILSTKKLIIN